MAIFNRVSERHLVKVDGVLLDVVVDAYEYTAEEGIVLQDGAAVYVEEVYLKGSNVDICQILSEDAATEAERQVYEQLFGNKYD